MHLYIVYYHRISKKYCIVPKVHLCGEDVAGAPCDIGSKLEQSFDEDSGLDGHVKTPGDPCTSQRLLGPVDATEVHQTGHFILSEGQLLAAPVSKGDVS